MTRTADLDIGSQAVDPGEVAQVQTATSPGPDSKAQSTPTGYPRRIIRIWHSWASPEDADAYENLWRDEILARTSARNMHGIREIKLLRRKLESEVEFITIMSFDSLTAIRDYYYDLAVVPPEARQLLARHDQRSLHYELRVEEPIRWGP